MKGPFTDAHRAALSAAVKRVWAQRGKRERRRIIRARTNAARAWRKQYPQEAAEVNQARREGWQQWWNAMTPEQRSEWGRRAKTKWSKTIAIE